MGDTKAVVEAAYLGVLDAPDTDAGASALASAGAQGWAEVSREVVALVGRVTLGCRRRGWEHPDLVRMARRELRAEHVALAEALVEALAEGAEPSAAFLTAYGRLARLDRFGTATVVLELLRLYGRLPAITPLAAPSAAAPAGPAHRMLGRIRALLAKAESTPFPQEAEALSAKAQHLMARHSIDEALLPEHATDGPLARRIGVDRPYEGAKALLLDAVAAANRCQAVWSGDFGFSTVVGFEPDLDAVELLYTSLLVQADAAMQRGGSKSKNFRQSFLIAYAGRIRDRLTSATDAAANAAAAEADAEAGAPEVLPVLAAREVAVGAATQRMFPATTTHRLKGRDREGWDRGTAAADRAALDGRGCRATGSGAAAPPAKYSSSDSPSRRGRN